MRERKERRWLSSGVRNDPAEYWELIGQRVVVSTPGQAARAGTLISVGAAAVVLHSRLGGVHTVDRLASTRIRKEEDGGEGDREEPQAP